MSPWSKLTATVRRPLNRIMEGVARRRAERKQKRKEKRWRRTKETVRAAQAYCKSKLANQLWDEHLKTVMTARISDTRLPGIGEARIHWLHRAGIKTAYDVYDKGVEGMNDVYSIGPTLAESLVEWAHEHVPESFTIDNQSREYFDRLRALKRQHLDMAMARRQSAFQISPPKKRHVIKPGQVFCDDSGRNYRYEDGHRIYVD